MNNKLVHDISQNMDSNELSISDQIHSCEEHIQLTDESEKKQFPRNHRQNKQIPKKKSNISDEDENGYNERPSISDIRERKLVKGNLILNRQKARYAKEFSDERISKELKNIY